tara:strand:+ start:277 stop:693 length:417 start_codon:yes stop_codon:yes gene_type:complete
MLLLQSCSNTFIGEKLENSFDIIDNPTPSSRTDKGKKKLNEKKSIESSFKDDKKKNKTDYGNIIKENSISNKDRGTQKSTKSIRKIIFNPQPYRIILRLSGANPSAPAETVTRALRKAGVQFEVEKIERFDKDTSIKR